MESVKKQYTSSIKTMIAVFNFWKIDQKLILALVKARLDEIK